MVEKRKKVGLALGTGVARGLAHIGVLKVLEQEGIPIDMIAGTSIGALIGAFYSYGQSIEEMEALAKKLGAKRLNFLFDPCFPKTGLIRGRRIEQTLRSVLAKTEFSDLKIPFACIATNIDTGEEVIIDRGQVWEAVRASSSVPVVLAVASHEGRYLVDGALVNPVPVSVVKEMGADFIIAVNVVPYRELPGKSEPNLFTVVMRTVDIGIHQLIQASLAGANVVIQPEVETIGYADFHHVKEAIACGEEAAMKMIPEIKRLYASP